MIVINPLEKKGLEFDVSISGIEPKQLEGFLRFKVGDVEYGFPVDIGTNKISVDLPPLNEKIGQVLDDGSIIDGRLELVGNNFFMKTWQGEFQIQSPVTVKTKLVGESDSGEIKVTGVAEKSKKLKSGKYIMSEEPPEEAKSEIPPKELKEKQEEAAQAKVNEKLKKVSSFVDQFLESGRKVRPTKPVKESTVPKKKKAPVRRQAPVPTEMTSKGDVYAYMKSKGLGSSRVQEALYERAEERSESKDFQGIYEQIKTMLSVQKGNF